MPDSGRPVRAERDDALDDRDEPSAIRLPRGAAWLGLTALLCLGALLVASAGPPNGRFGAVAASRLDPSAALDWRPGLASLAQPWRLWTCAWVHWSAPHLLVNLLGAVVVGAVGWRARAPGRAALAWFVAWPLTHLLMELPVALGLPSPLLRYGGLSGVLHAGVVVLGLSLAWPAGRGRRSAGAGESPMDSTGFAPDLPASAEPSRLTEGPWAMSGLDELSGFDGASRRHRATRRDEPLVPLTPAQARRHRWIGAAIVAGTVAKVASETPWNPALRPNAMLGIDVAPLAHACGIGAGVLAWAGVTLALAVLVRDTTATRGWRA